MRSGAVLTRSAIKCDPSAILDAGRCDLSQSIGLAVLHDIFAACRCDSEHRGLFSELSGHTNDDLLDKATLKKTVGVELGNAYRKAKLRCRIFCGQIARLVEEEFKYLKCEWIEVCGWLKAFYLSVAICYKLFKFHYALRETRAVQ